MGKRRIAPGLYRPRNAIHASPARSRYSRPQTAASSDIMPDIVVALLEKVKEVRRQEADAAFMAEEAKRQQVSLKKACGRRLPE